MAPGFSWPDDIRAMPVDELLSPSMIVPHQAPEGERQQIAYDAALQWATEQSGKKQAQAVARGETWFLTTRCSKSWSSRARPSVLLPALTFSMSEGPWIPKRARSLNPEEAARMQGLTRNQWQTPEFSSTTC